MPKKKTASESAGSRIKRQGKSLIWVAVDDAQKRAIRLAAAHEDTGMGQFLLSKGLTAAERILEKIRNSS